MLDDFTNDVIGRIYDCAVDPDQWDETLTIIRDRLDVGFLSMHFMSFPPTYPQTPPDSFVVTTEWDGAWLEALQPLVSSIPHFDQMVNASIDAPLTQLQLMDEADFQQSDFYKKWVEPQGLRDTLNTNLIKRDNMTAILSGPSLKTRALFSEEDIALVRTLSPHFRRALLISEMMDESNARIQIYRKLLDRLSIGVFLVEQHSRIMYHNEAAETLMSEETCITGTGSKLAARSTPHAAAFAEAIERACSGSDTDIGLWGNGMALPAAEGGDAAIAYVLPLGRSDRRRALGPGLAAVFITTQATARPPALEVLTALSGMTIAEARVSLAISDGLTVEATAQDLGISPHTVRKHLSNVFDKVGVRTQPALGAFVNRLQVPIVAKPEGSAEA